MGSFLTRYVSIAALVAGALLLMNGCSSGEPTEPPATTTAPPANQSPIIDTIIAPQEVLSSTTSDIQAVGSDPDGDPITYMWTASGGQIEGSGSIIKWIAPQTSGDYTVEVKISDGAGGEDYGSIAIKVGSKPNTPPMLSFKLTGENKAELVVLPGDTEPINVAQWKTVQIECIAEDAEGDEVNFLWAASAGKIESIEGKSNPVKYIATTRGDDMVICTAIDSRGARSQASVYFFIPCCGQGSFGNRGM